MSITRGGRRGRVAHILALIGLALAAGYGHAQDNTAPDAPPAADETLIYVIREGRMLGAAVGQWIAINDQVVARLRSNRHAVMRAKAGLITLNLSNSGVAFGQFVADDRPGETIYLLFDIKGFSLVELSAEEGREYVADTKRMEDIDAPRNNNEYYEVLMNPGQMGFDLMRPATAMLEPDAETAVITFLRRREKDELDIGVWGADGFLGDLESEESFQIRVPPGEHYFMAGNNGSSLVRAIVEAGRQYYVWIDVGAMFANVKAVPIETRLERDLREWLDDATPLELNPDAFTDRIRERIQLTMPYIEQGMTRAGSGEIDSRLLAADHAF